MERNEDSGEFEGALFKASFRFIGTDSTVISLLPGQTYLIIEKTTEDWWLAANDQGQIGYVPGNYLQERLGRNSSLAHRYCEVGLNQLITESTTRVPTSENRALIKKISDLKKRIQRWSLDGDSSLSESELKPRLAPPQRTASLPSKKKRAPAPPSLSRGYAASTGGSGPMLHSSLRHGSLPNFQPDRIEYIKSMQSPSQSEVFLEDSESTTSNEEAWRGETGDVTRTPAQTLSQTNVSISTNRKITDSDISVALDELQIPDDIGSSLVRLVKTESDLGSVKSRQLLRSVLSHLGSQIPILDRLVDKILNEFLAEVKFSRDSEVEDQLNALFKTLEAYKDDIHQITNPIGDDTSVICELLAKILKICRDSHPDTVLVVVQSGNFHNMMVIVNYYQLEHRREIRSGMLQILAYILSLSQTVGRQLVPTVFTVECARDIRDSLGDENVKSEYICSAMETFTELLSVQEKLTVFAEEHLNQEWLTSILNYTENGSRGAEVIDSIVNLMLAFNLHFDDVRLNIVMTSLSTNIESWANISERIMLFTNRGSDPIELSDPDGIKINSILKFLQDIFCSAETSSFFYTSDRNILVEILLRNLLDLDSDSTERTEYLFLLKNMIMHSDWHETKHKYDQLKSILSSLANDDAILTPGTTSWKNKNLAHIILTNKKFAK